MDTSSSPAGTEPAVVEQLTRIETMLTRLCQHLGISSEGASDPPPLSSPSQKGKLSNTQRYAVLQVVWEHLMTVPELTGTFFPISGTEKYRIYFGEDSSYLWCNEWGKLYAGIKGGDQTCKAQKILETYGLDKK